jgi:beta-glucanase (GH16 family)
MPMKCWVPFFALAIAAVNCQVKKNGLALSSSPDTGSSVEPEPIVDAADVADVADAVWKGNDVATTASGGVPTGGTDAGVVTGAGGATAVSTGGALASGGAPSPSSGFGGAVATGGSGIIGPGGVPILFDAAGVPDAPADERLESDASDAAAPVAPDASLTLVWSDEFDSSSIAGVDTSKWSYVTWDPGHVNNEAQKYTNRLENVFQDGNGYLVLRALNTPFNGFQYTSGRVETNGKFSFKFGRIEVRAKLPAGIGSFPGIVMLGIAGNWPQCGELAIMEQYGQDKSAINSTAFAGGGPGSGDVGPAKYTFAEGTSASSDFHLYSLDWYADHLVFQVDGAEVTRSTFDKTSPLYSIPEYIVLDVALGGDKGGAIKASQFPMEMIVDYVRVYSLQ